MKILTTPILAFIIFAFTLRAQDGTKERVYHPGKSVSERVAGQPAEDLKPLDEWTPVQIGFFPGFPQLTENSNVNGLKLGLPMSSGRGRVFGLEASIFSSTTKHMKGFQTSVFANVCDYLDGVQAGLVNIVNITCDGVQFGLVNYSEETGVQFGLVNIISKGSIPFMIIFNAQVLPHRSTYIQTAPPLE